jgi:glycerol-3-phosphate acyltransferase PlsX
VAVCDGFVGNIILKYSEGFAKGIMSMLKEELMSGAMSKLGAMLSKGAYGRLRKRFDYTQVGGAPFVGLNGLVVKAHGSSNDIAVKNAVKQCGKFIKADVVGKIRDRIDADINKGV